MLTNRRMTDDEHDGYGGAFYGYVFDSEDYQSRLYVAPSGAMDDGSKAREFLLYGDLREAFGLSDSYEPDDKGHFGNHAAAHLIGETPGFEGFAERVDMNPEGATFFAYTPSADTAMDFADFIARAVAFRREQVRV